MCTLLLSFSHCRSMAGPCNLYRSERAVCNHGFGHGDPRFRFYCRNALYIFSTAHNSSRVLFFSFFCVPCHCYVLLFLCCGFIQLALFHGCKIYVLLDCYTPFAIHVQVVAPRLRYYDDDHTLTCANTAKYHESDGIIKIMHENFSLPWQIISVNSKK